MNEKELQLVLEEGEGYKIEFKEALTNIDKELVAFANSSGGRIFLGITDDKKSVLRNPSIAGILHRVKYIEKMGTGINKMRGLIAEAGLPPIVFEFGTFFTAIFRRPVKKETIVFENAGAVFEAISDTINEVIKKRLTKELLHIVEYGFITRAIIEDTAKISTATAKRDLSLLKKLGFIKFKGARKTGGYVLAEKGKKIMVKFNEVSVR